MKRKWLVRAAAFGAAVILAGGVLVPHAVQETSAAWKDRQGAIVTSQAISILEPKGIGCKTTHPILNGKVATFSWDAAQPIAGSKVTYKVVGRPAGTTQWTFEEVTSKTSYAFNAGLLGGLLDGLLKLLFGGGDRSEIGIIAIHDFGSNTWESTPQTLTSIVYAREGLLTGFACEVP